MEGHENALFLSSQRRRITVRSIELLVKKYASTVTGKHITPHKLRSTYGTNLYKETGDIYLVADVLGHSDVNTTRKHYAELEEDRKRSSRMPSPCGIKITRILEARYNPSLNASEISQSVNQPSVTQAPAYLYSHTHPRR